MNPILKLYERLNNLRVVLPRLKDSRIEFKMKMANLDCGRLTPENEKLAKIYWGGVYNKLNNRYLSAYNTFSDSFDPRYVPDDFYYSKIDTYFNDALECQSLDDKNLYDLYFPDVLQPETILRKVGGIYESASYDIIDEKEAVEKCVDCGDVVIKPTTLSEGGRGLVFWKNGDDVDILRKSLCQSKNTVVQKRIKQHQAIAQLHPSSVNTIRIISLTTCSSVKILSGIIRMGANDSKVDNGHSGGCFVGLTEDGRLKNRGFNFMTGQLFDEFHPTTHFRFSDAFIPNYEQCKNIIRQIAPRLSRVSRLTSWDFSVDEKGQPVLIEVNLCYGGLFFHQMANGPLFGDESRSIVEKCLNTKK